MDNTDHSLVEDSLSADLVSAIELQRQCVRVGGYMEKFGIIPE
ncbi:hypothetical protein [uncultured Nostoc sp.]